jgi:toxin FitB
MIILDTNVISALMRDPPDFRVVAWLNLQPRESLWTTSVSIFELRFGLQIMPQSKRRSSLEETLDLILEKIEHRIASFDVTAAERTADLSAIRKKKGQSSEMRDTMIAGIVLAHNATLATGNVTHFQDISATVVNPWTI